MLPKRLAIAFLLHKRYEQRLVSQYLKVSFTTITRVSNQLRTGGAGYRRVIEKIIADDKLKAFVEKIDDAIAELVGPHTVGRGNWSRWRSERWKKKMAAKKPF